MNIYYNRKYSLGCFSILSTPIGNIKDITYRSIEVIYNADILFVENISNSINLLKYLFINYKLKKIISYRKMSEDKLIKYIIRYIKSGLSVVVSCDAGTPGINDPGNHIIKKIYSLLYVEIVPGVSALTTSIMGAGIHSHRFIFLGFLPKRNIERKKIIKEAYSKKFTMVLYEKHNRLANTLYEIYVNCGPVQFVIARELTKYFETFHYGKLDNLNAVVPSLKYRGEMVIIIELFNKVYSFSQSNSYKKIIYIIKFLIKINSLSNVDIIKRIAQCFKLSKNQIYKLFIY